MRAAALLVLFPGAYSAHLSFGIAQTSLDTVQSSQTAFEGDRIPTLAYDAALVVTPQLLTLAARTENLTVRCAALLTLARVAFSPATAK